MASNTLAGFGFRGAQLYSAAASNFAMNTFVVAYNDTVDIGYGDPVLQNSSGVIASTATTFSTNGVTGIFRGCFYADSGSPGGMKYLPNWPGVALASSATVVTAFVETDPAGTYLAQYSGTKLTQTAIGNNLDILTGTSSAPNTAGFSTCVLDAASLATTALPFRIVGILGVGDLANAIPPATNGSVANDNGWVLVKINNSTLYTGVTYNTGI